MPKPSSTNVRVHIAHGPCSQTDIGWGGPVVAGVKSAVHRHLSGEQIWLTLHGGAPVAHVSVEVVIFIALVIVMVAVLLGCQLRSGSAPGDCFQCYPGDRKVIRQGGGGDHHGADLIVEVEGGLPFPALQSPTRAASCKPSRLRVSSGTRNALRIYGERSRNIRPPTWALLSLLHTPTPNLLMKPFKQHEMTASSATKTRKQMR